MAGTIIRGVATPRAQKPDGNMPMANVRLEDRKAGAGSNSSWAQVGTVRRQVSLGGKRRQLFW